LFSFEELKRTKNKTGRTVSPLLTEELLEKIMLKSTKTDKTDKKLNHLSFQSME
jgi:hypothetical protein